MKFMKYKKNHFCSNAFLLFLEKDKEEQEVTHGSFVPRLTVEETGGEYSNLKNQLSEACRELLSKQDKVTAQFREQLGVTNTNMIKAN